MGLENKLELYDHFMAFEDDMLITADTIQNYMDISDELMRLRKAAPDKIPRQPSDKSDFYGALSKPQLQRMIPGFIRVEVLLDEEKYGAQTKLDPVPIVEPRPQADPRPCCELHNPLTWNDQSPGQ